MDNTCYVMIIIHIYLHYKYNPVSVSESSRPGGVSVSAVVCEGSERALVECRHNSSSEGCFAKTTAVVHCAGNLYMCIVSPLPDSYA